MSESTCIVFNTRYHRSCMRMQLYFESKDGLLSRIRHVEVTPCW